MGFRRAGLQPKPWPKPLRLTKAPRNACTVQNAAFTVASARAVGAWFCAPLASRRLSHLSRPVGRFHTELLGVLRVQPLPAGELHGLTGNDAAEGGSAKKPIQNIETNVPPGSPHGDEAPIDVVPQR